MISAFNKNFLVQVKMDIVYGYEIQNGGIIIKWDMEYEKAALDNFNICQSIDGVGLEALYALMDFLIGRARLRLAKCI